MHFEATQVNKIVQDLYNIYHYDIVNYSVPFLQRMLVKFAKKHDCYDFESFQKLLLHDETLIQNFLNTLHINVSEMFRDPPVFQQIRKKIIPYIASYPIIKIWSVGCASGQEVYSLAIMLKEAGLYERSIIYATDISKSTIESAIAGKYKMQESLKYFENYYLSGGTNKFSQYFDIEGETLIVKDSLKKNIYFATHNIATDDVFNIFSLIICRNVLIYFDTTLKNRAFNVFQSSLEELGFLILGKSENINHDYFQDYDTINRVYKLKN